MKKTEKGYLKYKDIYPDVVNFIEDHLEIDPNFVNKLTDVMRYLNTLPKEQKNEFLNSIAEKMHADEL